MKEAWVTDCVSKRILLTGRPGVGKTTALTRVVEDLRGRSVPIAGFYTKEVREGGRRLGFDLVDFEGGQQAMARSGMEAAHSVGRYGVDVQAVDRFAQATKAAIEDLPDDGVVLIDEVGRMELFSSSFRDLVEAVVVGRSRFVLTVTQAKVPLARRLLDREDVAVLQVTGQNRDALPARILEHLADPARGSG